ncbi:NAD-dependent epimerase/dehydratase family protein [Actinobacillus equuli]|uniref:NAD-dependent epimerase/dehydratase family protein n=1 Tax=Actinobacillus equuli TaxID=718 RepID=UPI0024432DC8|nr:NAD(P)-dependent oxidoreductase [Actinobacillus equuli]WGE46495.1 NAD(P)-dependent oxidoreductase [Actinobacillus equuli subsp. haemolyticus]WGE81282.1 NAD(P)-dependent oxidoreductase [Actinobacillus equuli subsp. haemolyticus]
MLEQDFKQLSQKLSAELSQLEGKSILLVGATGAISSYLGRFLIYVLQAKIANFQLTLTARSEKSLQKYYSETDKSFFKCVFLDVKGPFQLAEQYDYIIFAAGNADPKNIVNNPLDIIHTNYLGLHHTLEFAKVQSKTKIVFFSTREIYGMVSNKTVIEENDIGVLDPLNFRSCYPEVKKLCENMLECAVDSYAHLSYSILRLAHIYGPGMNIQNDGRIMNDLVEMTVNGKGIKLLSDGSAVRAFCYISDAVTGIIKAMLVNENKAVFNVANETEAKSIREVVALIQEIFPALVPSVEYAQNSNANAKGYFFTTRTELSTKRLESLGWKPETSLAEGLKKTIQSYLEN